MTRKPITLILCSAALTLLFASCSSPAPATPAATASLPPAPVGSADVSDTDTDNAALLEKISVTMEVDSALKQAIITVSNNSGMTFKGQIHVFIKDSTNENVGNDMLIVEDLSTGNTTFARIPISATDNVHLDYKFSEDNCEFTEGSASSGGTVDTTASSELTKKFGDSFGGAGNPANATSWYKHVVSIEVFSGDNDTYAVVTVSTNDHEAVDRIGNTIFGNYYDDYLLDKVLVVDESGTTLFERET